MNELEPRIAEAIRKLEEKIAMQKPCAAAKGAGLVYHIVVQPPDGKIIEDAIRNWCTEGTYIDGVQSLYSYLCANGREAKE